MAENSMRPGIYVDYEMNPVSSGSSGKTVGIVAEGMKEANTLLKAFSLTEGKEIFGPRRKENPLGVLAEILFTEGVSGVYAVIPSGVTADDYQRAFDLLLSEGAAEIFISDSVDMDFYTYEQEKILSLGDTMIGKYLVLPADLAGSAEAAAEIAKSFNCERVCMAYPEVYSTEDEVSQAVLASMMAKGADLAGNLNGSIAAGEFTAAELTEEEVNLLIRNGVCVLEEAGSSVELIRGVTTRTLDEEGNSDPFYRNISVPMIADRVVLELRELLLQRIKESPGGETALSSLASLIICKLEALKEEGIVSSYSAPKLQLSERDASVCLVEVSFTAAQWFSQIYLKAHITV